ncbi:group II intron reverse transcriptase/maturase [Bariatricus sp. HCP28S3_A7]|uniref:group II intron reverse transcriptase/maturase n=1 Tax=Bariatricus sp. HCP28S3_A7 TaxID=3438894 RepID=UPI003F89DC6B
MPNIGQQHSIEKSRQLQRNLYLAAKKDKQRRFHALYDRIFRLDILWRAWKEVRENKGSAGIDGITFEMIEEYGVEEYLLDIQEDLKNKKYRPKPVKRVYIPKPDGKQRPLGIPTIRDRIVQQACKIVIEPVFEANFLDSSYGFRPKRDAKQATEKVKKELYKNWYVVDADIQGYFENINHEILLGLINRRISDRRVIKLCRQWLQAGVIENGKYYPTEKGSPQGGVISPLLANIYLHVLDSYWGKHKELGVIVRYADDCIIMVGSEMSANRVMRNISRFIEEKLGLKVNVTKSKVDRPSGLKYLGFGFYFDSRAHQYKAKPHAKSVEKFKKRMKILTRRSWGVSNSYKVEKLNQLIRGWINYFKIGSMKTLCKELDANIRFRLRKCIWKHWKNPQTRERNLMKLGIDKKTAHKAANCSRAYAHVCSCGAVNIAITNKRLTSFGLVSMLDYYTERCVTC